SFPQSSEPYSIPACNCAYIPHTHAQTVEVLLGARGAVTDRKSQWSGPAQRCQSTRPVRNVYSLSISAAVAPFGAEACRFAARHREMNRDWEPFHRIEVSGRQEERTRSLETYSI